MQGRNEQNGPACFDGDTCTRGNALKIFVMNTVGPFRVFFYVKRPHAGI